MPPRVASNMATDAEQQAEIRLMGLILAQSIFVGVAVGIFYAELWLRLDGAVINGVTYAMGGFAMQGLGYYVFKMFFQQNMDERMHLQEAERRRQNRYREMQRVFDSRREDLELRMQEAQLESELRYMEQNPGRSPTWGALENEDKIFNPSPPDHRASAQEAMSLGVSFDDDDEPNRGADGKFKKKES